MSKDSKPKDPKVVCRRAQIEDKEGIIGILPHHYGGAEYIGVLFGHYMSRPDIYHPYVAEIEGRIVAVTMYIVVDDHSAVVYAANRVSKDVQGAGVMRVLGIESGMDMYKREPVALMSRLGTAMDGDRYRNPNHRTKILYRRGLLLYKVTAKDLRQLVDKEDFSNLYAQYNCKDVQTLVSDATNNLILDEKNHQVFPGGRFCFHWIPMKVMKSNVEYISSRDDVIVLTTDDKKILQAATFMLPLKLDGAITWSLDMEIYRDDDPRHTVQHFLEGIRYCSTLPLKSDDSIFLAIFIPKQDVDMVESLGKTLGLELATFITAEKHMVVFEVVDKASL